MRRLILLAGFVICVVGSGARGDGIYPANSSNDFYPIIASVFRDLPTCKNIPICRFVERLRTGRESRASSVNSNADYRNDVRTGIEPRSYYSGYAGNPMTPALYPAIDTVSVLASLAFLAFLLHSFASLFDRSRSIFPSMVSTRQASPSRDIPDPVKLILRALDEYDILSNDVIPATEKTVVDV